MQAVMVMVPCGHGRPPDARGMAECSVPHLVSAQAPGVTMEAMAALGGGDLGALGTFLGRDRTTPRGCETPGKWTPSGWSEGKEEEALLGEIPAVAPKRKCRGASSAPSAERPQTPQFPPAPAGPGDVAYSLPGAMIVDSHLRGYILHEDRDALFYLRFPCP